MGKWHLGGTADGHGLPTRHGFDSYWGMPITNVQACRAGHQEYIHSSLWAFLIDRSPTNVILLALAVIALTPYVLGFYARWTIPTLLACLSWAVAMPSSILWQLAIKYSLRRYRLRRALKRGKQVDGALAELMAQQKSAAAGGQRHD